VVSAEGDDDIGRFIFVIKGHGRAAAQAIKRHTFETLNRRAGSGSMFKEHNARSRAVYKNEWFRYEGALRERLKGPEGFESLIVMSAVEQEYRAT
jgi:diamine N-acetyltransferase